MCVFCLILMRIFTICFAFVTKHLCPHSKVKLHQRQIFCILSVVRIHVHHSKFRTLHSKKNVATLKSCKGLAALIPQVNEQRVKIPPYKIKTGVEDTPSETNTLRSPSLCPDELVFPRLEATTLSYTVMPLTLRLFSSLSSSLPFTEFAATTSRLVSG